MPKIFISYRRDDSEDVTGRIHDRLKAHFGHEEVFIDIDTIPFGVDFRQHLQKAVGQCDILLAVIGDRWLDIRHQEGPKAGQRRLDDHGDFVRIEVQAALDRGIPVIPVLVGKATMPGEAMLPQQLLSLAYRNATEVRSGRDFHVHVDRLVRGIEHLAKHETASQAMEPKQPTVWEVAVPGWWYARTAGDSSVEWRKVTDTPARVTVVPEEEYRLQLIPGISDEQLGGLAYLASLTSLHRLELRVCELVTDAGLAHLKGLTSLQDLDLSCTAVTDAGLVHLTGLTSLQDLDLWSTAVTDAGLAHLKGLTSLHRLDLSWCELVTDAGLAHLKGLTSLQDLSLGGTAVTDAGLAYLMGLTSLHRLDLSCCELVTDAGLAHLKGLTSLHRLDLSWCERVADAGLPHLEGLTSLQDLSLGGTAVTDAGLAYLKGLTSLHRLDLKHCELATDAGLAHITGLASLQNLMLSHTAVTDVGVAHLKGLTSLHRLDLRSCELVTGAGLAHLTGLTSLQELDLGSTPVTDAGLAHLKDLTTLRSLHLSQTGVTDVGLAHLKDLTSLRELKLWGTAVTNAGLAHLKEKHQQRIKALEEARRADLQNLAAQIAQCSLTIEAKSNADGQLYGSVNADQIADALKTEGFPIQSENIRIERPLKELGLYAIRVHLAHDIEGEVKLWVVPTHEDDTAS